MHFLQGQPERPERQALNGGESILRNTVFAKDVPNSNVKKTHKM